MVITKTGLGCFFSILLLTAASANAQWWRGTGHDFADPQNWGGLISVSYPVGPGSALSMAPLAYEVYVNNNYAGTNWIVPPQSEAGLGTSLTIGSLHMESYDQLNRVTLSNAAQLTIADPDGLTIGRRVWWQTSQGGLVAYSTPAQNLIGAEMRLTNGSTLNSVASTMIGYDQPGVLTVESGATANLANFNGAGTSSGLATLNVGAASSLNFSGSFSLGLGEFRINNAGMVRVHSNATSLRGVANQDGGRLVLTGSATFSQGVLLNGVNRGRIEVTEGANLSTTASINNTGGTIVADGVSSSISLRYGTNITGGTLSTINGGSITSDGAELADLTNTGTVNFYGPRSLSIGMSLRGTIHNTGVIQSHLDNGPHSMEVRFGESATLTGSGQVRLRSAEASILGAALTNQDNTISGYGIINAGLINNGVVNADVNSKVLYLGLSEKFNTGVMKATNGGTLVTTTSVNNTGGTILADGGNSSVTLGAGTITGGTLATGNGGSIVGAGAKLADLTNSGTLAFYGSPNLSIGMSLRGTIHNTGVIQSHQDNVSHSLDVSFGETATLTGGGEVRLRSADSSISGVIVNQDNTFRGYGAIHANLTNHGVVDADINTKVLYLTASPKINTGVMKATNGGTLVITAIVNNTDGTILADGGTVYSAVLPTNYAGTTLAGGTWEVRSNSLLQVDGMNIVTNSASIIFDGANSRFTSSGSGTSAIAGLSTNSGLVAVRNGAHVTVPTLLNNGTVTVAGGTVSITSTAAAPLSGVGQIDIQGGQVLFEYAGGATPAAAVRSMIEAGRNGGDWSGQGITSSLAAGLPGRYAVGYGERSTLGIPGSTEVVVSVSLLGDFNLDGAINFSDLLVLAQNYGPNNPGKVWTTGDADYNAFTDFSDLLALAQNYGQAVSAMGDASLPADVAVDWALARGMVPEPNFLIATLGLLAVCRRNRQAFVMV